MRRVLLTFVMLATAVGAQTLTVTKTSYESFDCSVDFTQVIGADAMTLSSVTATSKAGDATATVIASSPAPAIMAGTAIVTYRVQGGQPGTLYRVSVKVIDATNGAQWEGVMLLQISTQ